jgi:succinoglycan biosynthesis protein ExoA
MLLASLTMLLVFWPASIVIPGLYLGANVIVSVQAARHRGWQYLPVLPLVFTTVHMSWGLGFLFGLGRFGVPRLSWKSVMRAFRSPTCL